MAQRRAFLNALLIAGVTAVVAAVVILSWVPPASRDALTHHFRRAEALSSARCHGGVARCAVFLLSDEPGFAVPGAAVVRKRHSAQIHSLRFCAADGRYGIFAFETATGCHLCPVRRPFFLLIPVVVKLSTTVYVDLGLVFFTTAAVIYLLRWAEGGLQWRHLLLSAVFCGLALGTKYNGLVTVGLLVFERRVPARFSTPLRTWN